MRDPTQVSMGNLFLGGIYGLIWIANEDLNGTPARCHISSFARIIDGEPLVIWYLRTLRQMISMDFEDMSSLICTSSKNNKMHHPNDQ